MKNDHVSQSIDPKAPKQLHKPRREAEERRLDEVITYSDECEEPAVYDNGVS